MTTEAISTMHPIVYSVAHATRSRYPYRSVPEYADHAWRWLQHHPERLSRALEECKDYGQDGTGRGLGRNPYTKIERALERHLERVGRSERAAAHGYRPEDETYYPLSLIELALPAVWDISLATLQSQDDGDDNEDGKTHLPKRQQDPAEGNNWLATVVDVRRGYEAAGLTQEHRVYLRRHYKRSYSVDEIARQEGEPPEFVDNIIQGALRKIQRQLGGERPTGCSPSCECGGQF